MAITDPDEIRKLSALLKEQAELQQQINSGLEGYINGVKKLKALEETVKDNLKAIKKLEESKIGLSQRQIDIAEAKIQILKEENYNLLQQRRIYRDILKDANKTKMTLAGIGTASVKGFGKLPGLFKDSFGKIKGFGLFEMDKSIRMSALQMGLLGNRGKEYQSTIRDTALNSAILGTNVKELAEMQASYSEELGRSVLLGQKGLTSMVAIAKATTLGSEGAAKMAAEMDVQGVSAERVSTFMENTLNSSTKLGLNASKVVKNISGNIKMLNRYSFKKGVVGLAKMAETTSRLGVDMEFASGFAEKLFNVEGAVDMAAQLQVMGGQFSKLADPFHLMYMARNDMEGLAQEIGNAAAASAHFNKETGQFDLSTVEMHRLRIIAEQTGIAYDDLVTAGKNAAKFTKIKSQLSFGGLSDEQKEFISNVAQLDEKGQAYIEVREPGSLKGTKKLVKDMDSSFIKRQMNEKATLEERIKMSQNFEDSLNNLISMVQVALLPVVDGINDVLKPVVDKLISDDGFKKDLKNLGTTIGNFVKMGAKVAKWFLDLATYLGPTGTLATVLGFKALGWLIDKGTWITNGLLLASGFMGGIKGGGLLSAISSTGTLGKLGMGIGGTAVGIGGGTAIGGGGKGAMIGSSLGSIAGGLLGQALIPIPGVGFMIGSALGGLAGGYFGGKADKPVSDAMFTSPLHDGLIGSPISGGQNKNDNNALSNVFDKLGSDYNKKRGILQGGKITPIDNKDDLLAMKPDGYIDRQTKQNNKPSTMEHKFDNININGEIKLVSPNNSDLKIDLSNNPGLVSEITNRIMAQLNKDKNGGKLKPA
jgi:hypothetical protein